MGDEDAEASPEGEQVLSPQESVEEPALEGVFTFVDGSRYEGNYVLVDGVRVRSGKGTMIQGPEVRRRARLFGSRRSEVTRDARADERGRLGERRAPRRGQVRFRDRRDV